MWRCNNANRYAVICLLILEVVFPKWRYKALGASTKVDGHLNVTTYQFRMSF